MEEKNLIIIGASGHGKVVADMANCLGYERISFLDDNPSTQSCMGFPVIGTLRDAGKYVDAEFIVAIGNATVRERIQREMTAAGLKITTLIHPKAVVSPRAKVGAGTVIMAGAVVNPDSIIGNGCIINTGASVDHDNNIGHFVHISVGSHLAGTVSVGTRSWIGAGAIVSNNITICSDCTIGAGAVVVRNIDSSGTYIGVPAKRQQNGK